MIPRKFRLDPADFPRQAPSVLRTSAFAVKAHQNTLEHHRFGLVVGVKAVKSSVKRHLLRRRFLNRALHLPGRRGTDLLFILSPGAAKLSRKDLDEEFLKLSNILLK